MVSRPSRTRATMLCLTLALTPVMLAAMTAHAEPYPSRPLRLVSPYAPGGGSDTLARSLGQKLNEAWGQQVVVDNRPGAAASIGTDIVHVPYKGSAPANVDLLAGVIQLRFASVVPVMPHVRAGRVRALAISSEQRYTPLPDMPTLGEAGLPGVVVESFYAILAPAATPRGVIDKLNAELVRILRDPRIKARMAADGADAVGSTPEELATALRRDHARWAKPVKDSGARAD